MTLQDLARYAEEKYHIQEEHKWADFPGFSVLTDPNTGKWAALLMRQWDTDSGTEIERCDIKCGREALSGGAAFLSLPFRMRGAKWLGVQMAEDTDSEAVFRLLDQALTPETGRGYTLVLDQTPAPGQDGYRDTPLPFAGRPAPPEAEKTPRQIRLMRTLYTYGDGSFREKCRNFYQQARFMQDYEDDTPWSGMPHLFFPTYHDLTVRQLRGYFAWRAHVRRGDYQPIAVSMAYLYLYELLNGVGPADARACLEEMQAFERGFLDAGYGDAALRRNLTRWKLEFAVLHGLPPEEARRYADPDMLARDRAMQALREPQGEDDEAVFQALIAIGGKKLLSSPVLRRDPARGKRLFSQAWRTAAGKFQRYGKDLFHACFGEKSVFPWHPLANTVCCRPEREKNRRYTLNESRAYICENGAWQVESYDRLTFDRRLFSCFLRAADRRLRRFLKTGSYLKEKPEEAWADPYLDAVLTAEQEREREAARPRIVLNLAGLDRIRQDASLTRDSLLTEEEWPEEEEEPAEEPAAPEAELPLTDIQLRLLRTLLRDESTDVLLREHHLMPAIVADDINEALFDLFGDAVLMCEDDQLAPVPDYREELGQLLGGTNE